MPHQAFFELVKSHDIKFVDLRFTDMDGSFHHLTRHIDVLTGETLQDGIPLDAARLLKPDATTALIDPFYAEPTIALFCDIHEMAEDEASSPCSRGVAQRAETYLQSTGLGDATYCGAALSFYLFEDARFECGAYSSFFHLDSREAPMNAGRVYPEGNQGHRPRAFAGDRLANPVDSAQDIRTEILSLLSQMGVAVEGHSHGEAACQHKITNRFDTLLRAADRLQLAKYTIRNVAATYGKTATFMPQPVAEDCGSGLHLHQSIWKSGKSLFAGAEALSETGLYYLGGVLRHARALNAFANPTTNSYRRIACGRNEPSCAAYELGEGFDKVAACDIPTALQPGNKRVALRFPDPCANPYLLFAATLMAGLDGIQNKIHPGEPLSSGLSLGEEKENALLCSSLDEALTALEQDHAFLLNGDVFTQELIATYIFDKRQECRHIQALPHPAEFALYFSA